MGLGRIPQTIGLVCVAGGFSGCAQIGGAIYEVQMRMSDAVQLEDGTWSEIDLAMREAEKNCMAKSCDHAKTDGTTYTACFKDMCRENRGPKAPQGGTTTEK